MSVDEEQVRKCVQENHNSNAVVPHPIYSCGTDEDSLVQEVITEYIGDYLHDIKNE